MKVLKSLVAAFMMVLLIGNTVFAQESNEAATEKTDNVSDENISVEDCYILTSSYGYNYLIAVCKSTSKMNLDVSWDTVSLDKDGSVIETGSSYDAYVSPGQEFVMYAVFLNSAQADNFNYNLHYEESTHMVPAFSDVKVDASITNESTLTISATNTSSTDISTVQASTLFFDKDGRLIGFDDSYLVNNSYNLEAGETVSKEVDIPQGSASEEVYYTAYRW